MQAMEAGDVLRVYDRLEDLGIESWIEGGWDLDALLERQTRPDEDLDLVVRVADVPRLLDALAEHGFRHVRGELDSNLVLRDEQGREVDVHAIRFDDHGNGIFRQLTGEDAVYAAEGFNGTGAIDGRDVRCMSVSIQLRHHRGFDLSHVQLGDMSALQQRFGAG